MTGTRPSLDELGTPEAGTIEELAVRPADMARDLPAQEAGRNGGTATGYRPIWWASAAQE